MICKVIVRTKKQGLRLDKYISEAGIGVSRSQAKKLALDRRIVIDGKIVKPSQEVRNGEEIILDMPDILSTPERKPLPEKIQLDIVYEDSYIVVINKPAGMVVHPGAGNVAGTLVNALLEHCSFLSDLGGEIRPGIVHRLDKDTSGLIVAAKTNEVHRILSKQLEERTLSRIYTAIIWGNIGQEKGEIKAPIGRSFNDRKKMAIRYFSGRDAVSFFRVLKSFDISDLVEVSLMTGRTHQIRVHFSHIGHPIVGDSVYGGRKLLFKNINSNKKEKAMNILQIIQRQALHAKTLCFYHPVKCQKMEFHSPIPLDMVKVIEILEK